MVVAANGRRLRACKCPAPPPSRTPHPPCPRRLAARCWMLGACWLAGHPDERLRNAHARAHLGCLTHDAHDGCPATVSSPAHSMVWPLALARPRSLHPRHPLSPHFRPRQRQAPGMRPSIASGTRSLRRQLLRRTHHVCICQCPANNASHLTVTVRLTRPPADSLQHHRSHASPRSDAPHFACHGPVLVLFPLHATRGRHGMSRSRHASYVTADASRAPCASCSQHATSNKHQHAHSANC